MRKKTIVLLAAILLGFITFACNPSVQQYGPSPAPRESIEPVFAQTPNDLPRTEAEVPRVTVEETKAALESGVAIIVDVRGQGAYETSHITGAVHIPLGEIETNPTGLDLDKNQWIITYCT